MQARVSDWRRKYALAVLTAIYMANTMDRGILAILAEPIRRDLAVSDTQFGVLTGLAFALFYTGFGLPAGWLADRVGRVRVIAIGCTIWSACSGAGSLGPAQRAPMRSFRSARQPRWRSRALMVTVPRWPLSLAFGLLAIGLSQMFLAPLLTVVQNSSPPEHRSLYSALFLLVNNLIGARFGPLYVGMVSDRFAAQWGSMSLSVGLAALLPVALTATCVQWRGSRMLPASPVVDEDWQGDFSKSHTCQILTPGRRTWTGVPERLTSCKITDRR